MWHMKCWGILRVALKQILSVTHQYFHSMSLCRLQPHISCSSFSPRISNYFVAKTLHKTCIMMSHLCQPAVVLINSSNVFYWKWQLWLLVLTVKTWETLAESLWACLWGIVLILFIAVGPPVLVVGRESWTDKCRKASWALTCMPSLPSVMNMIAMWPASSSSCWCDIWWTRTWNYELKWTLSLELLFSSCLIIAIGKDTKRNLWELQNCYFRVWIFYTYSAFKAELNILKEILKSNVPEAYV